MRLENLKHILFTGIRARLVWLYVAVFGAALIIYSALLYREFVENHQREIDVALYNYAIDTAYSIDRDLFGSFRFDSSGILGEGEKVFPFATGDALLQLRTIAGKVLAKSRSLGTEDLPFQDQDRFTIAEDQVVFKTIEMKTLPRSTQSTYRLVSIRVFHQRAFEFILQVAVPLVLLDRETKGMFAFFLFSTPVVLLAAFFLGLLFTRGALNPVRDMIRKASAISSKSLNARLPVPNGKDELTQLAVTFNDLLERLERSFLSQESFVADASHQLKTPLAIIKGEIEMLQRSKTKVGQYNETEIDELLKSTNEEISFLTRLVNDLLLLARMDGREQTLNGEKVRIDELILDLYSRLKDLAEKSHVSLKFDLNEQNTATEQSSEFEVNGDADLLKTMFFNLIENAIKYSNHENNREKIDDSKVSAGSDGQSLSGDKGTESVKNVVTLGRDTTVLIRIFDKRDSVLVEVEDQGPGIPESMIDKVFEPFFRMNHPSVNRTHGYGLGLSVLKKILNLHRGTIQILPRPDLKSGSLFRVRLPKIVNP